MRKLDSPGWCKRSHLRSPLPDRTTAASSISRIRKSGLRRDNNSLTNWPHKLPFTLYLLPQPDIASRTNLSCGPAFSPAAVNQIRCRVSSPDWPLAVGALFCWRFSRFYSPAHMLSVCQSGSTPQPTASAAASLITSCAIRAASCGSAHGMV